jgi:hypothetical protein
MTDLDEVYSRAFDFAQAFKSYSVGKEMSTEVGITSYGSTKSYKITIKEVRK